MFTRPDAAAKLVRRMHVNARGASVSLIVMVPDCLCLSMAAHWACFWTNVADLCVHRQNLAGDGSLDEACEEEPAGDGKRQIVDTSNELSWVTNLLAKAKVNLLAKMSARLHSKPQTI